MAKKKSKKKTTEKKPKKEQKKSVKEHVSKHMNKNVKVGTIVGVILVLAILFFPVKYCMIKTNVEKFFPVKYEATEKYIDINEYDEEYPVMENVSLGKQEVCEQVPAEVREEPDPLSPFVDPVGKEDFVCYAELRVWNMAESAGKWTYKYIFNVNGKDFEADPIEKEIATGSSDYFKFQIDVCKAGDKVTGHHELVKGPTVPRCEYREVFEEQEVMKTRTVTEEIEKTRKVTKTKALWKKVLGIE